MAKVVCVLYDDPVTGYPKSYARDDVPKLERYPDGQSLPSPKGIDFQPGQVAGQRLGCPGPAQVPGRKRSQARRHLGQGRSRLGPGAGVARCGHRHLAALLAGLHDRGAHRQVTEAQAHRHRRHRFGPYRSAGGDRTRDHGGRGHLLQQHQRRRARGDDDPLAGAQLHPVISVGDRQGLEHRRLRRAFLRSRRHGGRDRGGRAHRPRRAAPAQTLRCQAPLHRSASSLPGHRTGIGPHLPCERRIAGAGLRCGHHQLPAAPGDRAPLQRGAASAR